MHLVVDDKTGELITTEVKKRNRFPKPGERKATKKSVTEEAVIFWKENKNK